MIVLYQSPYIHSGNLNAGLGLLLKDIDRDQEDVLEEGRLLLYLAEIFYAFSLASSKFSILGFYWRLFKTSPIRNPILILAGCSVRSCSYLIQTSVC
jgi:hypothetical protein